MNKGPGRLDPVSGEKRAIVILVDFSDNTYTYLDADFDSLIYGENQNSMRDYYREASYGNFTISRQSNIAGWYRAPQNYSYYVGDSFGFYSNYPYNVQKLVEDACALADPDVDFSQYDGDGDGFVDGIFIVHAGPGAEEITDPLERIHHIWSHQWQLSDTSTGCPGAYQTNDGVKVDYYSTEPERLTDPAARITVGVFAHEFGHVLGLPDLYDRTYDTNGLGLFCLMAAGSWGQASSLDLPGNTPSHPCAWVKYQLAWLTPVAVERTGTNKIENQSIPCAARSPVAYRLLEDLGGPDWSYPSGGSGEYFIVENRFRTGFDNSLPGDGLLILHVDDGQTNNDRVQHPLVGIMQGDGDERFLLGSDTRGTANDLWKNQTYGFGDTSKPANFDYYGNPTGVRVYNIGAAESLITASFWVTPVLLGKVYAYPNPFIINKPPMWGRKAIITYVPTDTVGLSDPNPDFKVTIYNIAGERVRVLNSPYEVEPYARRAFWDLKNESGNDAVSGMYIFVVETLGDKIERNKGRLTIIR